MNSKSHNIHVRWARLLFSLLLVLGLWPASLHAADYYWIGGSGNWSDISHWVSTSGGTVNYSQVPTPQDDVYFDANSFTAPGQTITINSATATCKNLNFTGVSYNPEVFMSSANTLKVYGSLQLINNINFNVNGKVVFEATTLGNTIDFSGHTLVNDVYFQGLGGGWTLLDSLILNGSGSELYHVYGSLNTNSKKIKCWNWFSNYNNQRLLNLGSSEISIMSNADYGMIIKTTNLTLNPGSSHVCFYDENSGIRFTGTSPASMHNLTFFGQNSLVRVSNTTPATITFNNVVVGSDAEFDGDLTFNSLSLDDDHLYQFESGKTFTFISTLTVPTTCNSVVIFQTEDKNNEATFVKNGSPIVLSNLILYDIHASGTGGFVANNSVSIHNTTGWTINTPSPRTLYWVGGTGDWGDSSHWSTTSGGPGGACLPTPIDDVRFDPNSFNGSAQVNIDINNAVCHSMNWTGAQYSPYLIGGTNLRIYGSLKFIQNMYMSFAGKVRFEATTTGHTITSAGQTYKNNVYFDGVGGSWTLLDSFVVFSASDFIYHFWGTLNTNSKVVMTGLYVSRTGIRGLILMSSEIYVQNSGLEAWHLNSQFLTFNSGTSHIIFTTPTGGMRSSGAAPLIYYDVSFISPLGTNRMRADGMGYTEYHDVFFAGNGEIKGENLVDNLSFSGNKAYQIESLDTLKIGTSLNANGTCSGYISIYSSSAGLRSYITKDNGTINTQYLIIRDSWAFGGASFNAYSSIDVSGNQGWNIVSPQSIALYWVGGTGNWDDSMHWAYTSGGTPGACLPSPFNDVYFDVNSFSGPNQTVTVNVVNAYCHSMTWTGSQYNPEFIGANVNTLNVYGSLTLTTPMTYSFMGQIDFLSDTLGDTINLAGHVLPNNVNFIGIGGGWELQNDFACQTSVYHMRGTFTTNSYDITIGRWFSNTSAAKHLDLGSSTITATSSAVPTILLHGVALTIDPGTSHIDLVGQSSGISLTGAADFDLYDLTFQNGAGTGIINNTTSDTCDFHTVICYPDVTFMGYNTFDTLTFVPGRTYTLEEAKTQIIHDRLNIRGNNCFPIILRSTNPGYQSNIYKASGSVSGDFIDMRDQNAYGGAAFYAGNFSTDVSNNTGWSFVNMPGYVYGLGHDTTICDGDSVTFSTVNFNGGIAFLWQNNTTLPTLTVTTSGTYWVQVTYAAFCQLTDTIEVIAKPSIDSVVVQSQDISCYGANDAWIKLTTYGSAVPIYSWSNGQSVDSLGGLSPGTYSVTITDSTCTTIQKSIQIFEPQPLTMDFDSNFSYCGGTRWVKANVSGGVMPYTYLWSTGSTNDSIWGLQGGNYTITVTDAHGCMLISTAIVTSDPAVIASVASYSDLLCYRDSSGEIQTSVTGGFPPYSYVWSTSPPITTANATGLLANTYSVTVTDAHGCSDTTMATITEPNPLGMNLQKVDEGCEYDCDGEAQVQVSGGTLPYSLNWNTVPPQNISQVTGLCPGVYTMEVVDANGCLISDSVEVLTSTFITADFTVDSLIGYIPLDVQFTFTGSNAVTYLWDFGDGNSSTQPNPTHTYMQEGLMIVKLTVNSGAPDFCEDVHLDTIQTILRYPKFYIPNTFTPNGDGLNDVFEVKSVYLRELHVEIYNRWGQMVAVWDEIDGHWDGTEMNGMIAPVGTYAYRVTAKGWDDVHHERLGTVTLLR